MRRSGSTHQGREAGQALMEIIFAVIVVLAVLGGLVVIIASQSRSAIRLARDTRVRLLLEGELAYLRGQPAQALRDCKDQAFTPVLGVSKAFQGFAFARTIVRDPKQGVAAVKLEAVLRGAQKAPPRLVVEGVVHLEQE